MTIESPRTPHFGLLDACRGFLALWVLAGHCAHYTKVPELIPAPAFAVDLFMVLSGLLMVVMYRTRQTAEPFTNRSSWGAFYLRRFFRIAPVYYLLFFVALLSAETLGELSAETVNLEEGVVIGHLENGKPETGEPWEGSWTSGMIPYTEMDAINIGAHLTFLYGFIPALSSNNWTPDWSIGLEMQFYLFFPFLMLVVQKFGYLPLLLILTPLYLNSTTWFGLYGAPGSLLHFAQPAFLPLKINVFLIGMLLGEAISDSGEGFVSGVFPWLGGAFVLSLFGQNEWVQHGVIFLGVWIALSVPRTPNALKLLYGAFNRVASTRLFRFMADASYFTYLSHLIVIVFVRRFLASVPAYLDSSAIERFFVLTVITVLACSALAWFAHRYVEKPGIRLGRRVIARCQGGVTRT